MIFKDRKNTVSVIYDFLEYAGMYVCVCVCVCVYVCGGVCVCVCVCM